MKISGVGIIIYSVENREVKFLIGKRTDGEGWANAGGKVDEGELPIQSVVREIKEEFDINMYDWKNNVVNYTPVDCGCIYCQHNNKTVKSQIFKVMVNPEILHFKENTQEMEEIKWMSFEELATHDIFPPCLISLNCFMNPLMV